MKEILKINLNPNRVYGLDILRAFAILFVVAGHAGNLIESETYQYVNLFLFDGVNIFFVLSGFLIGRILIETFNTGKINGKLLINFWLRRWFRTVPNYFLILTIVIVLNMLFSKNFILLNKLKYYIFSQNLFSSHPHFFPEAWSLSIEEWFYIITPLTILVLIKGFKISINNSILVTAITIIISTTLFRYFKFSILNVEDVETWGSMFRSQVSTRLDSLMYGLIGAYVYINFFDLWKRYNVHLFIIGIILLIVDKFNIFNFGEFGTYYCVFSFSIVSIATLLLLPFLSLLKNGKGFIYKCLSGISLISYSMYLINYTIVLEWIVIKIDWTPLQSFNSYISIVCMYVCNFLGFNYNFVYINLQKL